MRSLAVSGAVMFASLLLTQVVAQTAAHADDAPSAGTLVAAVDPMGPTLLEGGGLVLDAPDFAHPHNWLGHTLRHLDGDLTHSDLATGLTFDVAARRATVQFGAFHNEHFGLGVDTDIKFAKGKATFYAAVNLGIAGKSYRLELPEISIVPRSHKGQRYVEYQIPVVRGQIDDLILGLTDPSALVDRLRFF